MSYIPTYTLPAWLIAQLEAERAAAELALQLELPQYPALTPLEC